MPSKLCAMSTNWIFAKVFLNTETTKTKGKMAPSINYLSGKRLIRATTTAAADAAAIMGNRVFLQQVRICVLRRPSSKEGSFSKDLIITINRLMQEEKGGDVRWVGCNLTNWKRALFVKSSIHGLATIETGQKKSWTVGTSWINWTKFSLVLVFFFLCNSYVA